MTNVFEVRCLKNLLDQTRLNETFRYSDMTIIRTWNGCIDDFTNYHVYHVSFYINNTSVAYAKSHVRNENLSNLYNLLI